MAADYGSTARALSLPISPTRTSSPNFPRPPWNSRRSQSNGAQGRSQSSLSYRDRLINNAQKFHRRGVRIYEKLSPLQRGLVVAANLITLILVILFFVYNEKIFGFLKPYAVSWKKTTGGWIILWCLTFIAAFPPIIGYSTCATLAGFVYGVGEGWLILASATIIGSTCSFLVSRFVLQRYVQRLVANDKRFAALTLTMKHDGLKLLCMIRLCPLPYSLSNGAISTVPTVHPLMYALATAIVSPKLLIHVFIGSRLAAIGESGGQMSAGAKALNWTSIVVGGLVGAFTGYYIYQRTMARARQLEAEEDANVRDAVTHTGHPPAEFMDDPETQAAATVLAQPDDGVDFFEEESSPTRHDYRDEFTDDNDVFTEGDGEEDAIDMHKQQVK
ncbi:hypothetical protein EPUS_07263 [Endocarpon pusillum Z07020]|uniref:Golgi apparatus membrane protein TVP38 n=1 Tax=Endocarpon pusillum (strain Z07020 / HMAS-L-300199) TaxID=1263415 RepID=U1GAQ9_ENDPU|nr:uncharacterized protein EPUS_07263 [Endocarpon pusillum Z07020]ERF68776.1 hypothetical protein EPUS_07263 [Endocarpon pusillum Z07020]